MPDDLTVLLLAAGSIGFVHTILGPDHYLPFIVMSRAGRWSLGKTVVITALCGFGHVLGSVVLGSLGIAFGFAVAGLETLESSRGDLAAWALMAFGLAYLVWGLRFAANRRPHTHQHAHPNGTTHEHMHTHAGGHVHVHAEPTSPSMTPWVLFTVFVLGPCEPLIPILMYPAAQESITGVAMVTLVFGAVTILTMLGVVLGRGSRPRPHLVGSSREVQPRACRGNDPALRHSRRLPRTLRRASLQGLSRFSVARPHGADSQKGQKKTPARVKRGPVVFTALAELA